MQASDPFAPVRLAVARRGGETSDHDLNPGTPGMERASLRDAAVLVGLRPGPRGLDLLLTRRASHLKHHPGQISLPGGKIEADDADCAAAAIREAGEEIGLGPEQAAILGTLPPHETVTGFHVTPVLAGIDPDFLPAPQEAEVSEVFVVPFAFVMEPANFRVEGRMWRGRMRHYYTVPYGPYYIWGATARILRALCDRMVS